MSYNLPKLLRKIPFHSKQDFFWRDLNRAFALLDDVFQMRRDRSGLPRKVESRLLPAQISRNRAFSIVDAMQAGADTNAFPKGMSSKPLEGIDAKKRALRLIKWFGNVNGDFVVETIRQAALENDIKFFRASLPNAINAIRTSPPGSILNYNGFVMGLPKLPTGKNCKNPWLAEFMVSFWCGTTFRAGWADPDLPPFCIMTDGAIADLLNLAFSDIVDLTSADAVQKCRERYELLSIKFDKRISTVLETGQGRLRFDADT